MGYCNFKPILRWVDCSATLVELFVSVTERDYSPIVKEKEEICLASSTARELWDEDDALQ